LRFRLPDASFAKVNRGTVDGGINGIRHKRRWRLPGDLSLCGLIDRPSSWQDN
jgi:hypothetical protein